MLPFHGDLLARMGQLPFAVLGATTLYALARRLGAAREHALYPAAFFLLSRPVLEQAIGANVDLICAAMFLTTLYLGIVAVDRDTRRDWMIWGVSFGLYAGSKYVALMYVPILLSIVIARGLRVRAAWALPGIAALAAPWYLRNWIVAGSPIYPATLKIAGITIARGAYDRAAMLNTVFHSTDLGLVVEGEERQPRSIGGDAQGSSPHPQAAGLGSGGLIDALGVRLVEQRPVDGPQHVRIADRRQQHPLACGDAQQLARRGVGEDEPPAGQVVALGPRDHQYGVRQGVHQGRIEADVSGRQGDSPCACTLASPVV